ncbi:hypothetical protein P168DRAFT_81883 [Aspergillus campestris IBT 28561]|uniref:Uncharacterized protein n=1 Tax=Aspergillus campestris (strain IBT 28561) TaxID=1392248 RepID=A0A2I1CQR3_ASPC2|nr:uncharacterized protein P168DRAFT_81883 [Aspergillus campestris IBT 28561]PKX99956.1 hypothetical protein P168DRAFT_81883 [Aspergillus campestris IBT 28561]
MQTSHGNSTEAHDDRPASDMKCLYGVLRSRWMILNMDFVYCFISTYVIVGLS